jgi:LysM repeat protein
MPTMTIGIFVLAAVILALAFWLVTRGGDDDDGSTANPTATDTVTAETTTTPSTQTTPGGTQSPGATVTGTGTPGTQSPGGGDTYTVVEGDTCEGIAIANGVELQDFYDANPEIDTDCSNLQVGQVVNIP